MALDEEVTFTFDFVPVGYRVYAEINVYRTLPETRDYRDEILVYTGKSEAIKVKAGENYLDLDVFDLNMNQNRIGDIQGTNDGDPFLVLFSNGKYLIREDVRIYSEGLWRTSPSIEGNPFENQSPFTLYLSECVYGRDSQDAFKPVIVELPEEKEIKIKNGPHAYFVFTGGAGRFSFGEEPIVVGEIDGSEIFIAGRKVEIIPTLWMCEHEVTQAEYTDVMETNPSYFTDDPAEGETQENRPVEIVSWYDCLVYCNKRSMADDLTPCYTISGKTDPAEWGDVPTTRDETWDAVTCNFEANGYRLPTEAECEYFARGGNTTNEGQTQYSGSDVIDNVAWYGENSDSKTHQVMKKLPNAKGIYDMTGNVREWCWDWYGKISSSTSLSGVASGTYRVTRGGNYDGDLDVCCVVHRGRNPPYMYNSRVGFRVVRSAN